VKTSVVIPVYNTEKYLPCCIESVLSQSFTDFEVLLIDDGSTDGSGDICDAYAEKDTRVRVFHKQNGGVSSARNLGLDNAKGEWVVFIDGDDLLADNALEYLMNDAVDDVDMVYGGIRKFDEKNDDLETIPVIQKERLSVEQAVDAFIAPKQRNGDWQRYMINRIYRMSIIRRFRLRFCTNIYYKEDGLFVVQYLCRCQNSVVCVPEIVYLYRQVANSAMGSLLTSYNPKLLTNVDAHGMICKELKKRGVGQDLLDRELRHLFQNYDWISGIMKQSGTFSIKNKWILLGNIIKAGGVVNFFYQIVILRYGGKVKKKLL
jgi:glycosyltransferase involved in cell wall biosynthesis